MNNHSYTCAIRVTVLFPLSDHILILFSINNTLCNWLRDAVLQFYMGWLLEDVLASIGERLCNPNVCRFLHGLSPYLTKYTKFIKLSFDHHKWMFIICPNHLVFVFFELRKKLVMKAEMFIKTEKGGFYLQMLALNM